MGWFDVSSQGSSFSGSKLWGDGPADLMDDFLAQLPEGTKISDVESAITQVFEGKSDGSVLSVRTETLVNEIRSEFTRVDWSVDLATVLAGLRFSVGMTYNE